MNSSDPWDDLLHAIGQGWPHYKDTARPLICVNTNQDKSKQKNSNCIWLPLILLIIIKQNRESCLAQNIK